MTLGVFPQQVLAHGSFQNPKNGYPMISRKNTARVFQILGLALLVSMLLVGQAGARTPDRATRTPTRTPVAATATTTRTPTPGAIPAWQPYTTYTVGTLVTYQGHIYRCLQTHTSLPGWEEPPNAPALWALVS